MWKFYEINAHGGLRKRVPKVPVLQEVINFDSHIYDKELLLI